MKGLQLTSTRESQKDRTGFRFAVASLLVSGTSLLVALYAIYLQEKSLVLQASESVPDVRVVAWIDGSKDEPLLRVEVHNFGAPVTIKSGGFRLPDRSDRMFYYWQPAALAKGQFPRRLERYDALTFAFKRRELRGTIEDNANQLLGFVVETGAGLFTSDPEAIRAFLSAAD